VRLSELAWNSARGLPRIDVDTQGDWTLHVVGKGDKERSIPLPRACGPILAGYRQAGGLAAAPSMLERLPLAHGEKGSALGARGLFDEVKHVLVAVAHDIKVEDPGGAALLRSASPHWLRHAYARRLVVDARVPLPAAQTLLSAGDSAGAPTGPGATDRRARPRPCAPVVVRLMH
jgi:integrase/recombinase XerC